MTTSKFPKIYALTYKEVEDILTGPVEVTEKVDGSQFGFGVIDGKLVVRSKGTEMNIDTPQGLFTGAVATVKAAFKKGLLPDGDFFYGESVQNKRHNKLTYDRVPTGNICLFGIKRADGSFETDHAVLSAEAERLGIDVVPLLYSGTITMEDLEKLLDTPSKFGPMMEGIVVKNYELPGKYSPIMVAKLVREDFKEVMRQRPTKGKDNDTKIAELFECYRTEARWDKAIQRVRETGADMTNRAVIGDLIRGLITDIIEEEEDRIKDALWLALKKDFERTVTKGFVDYFLSQNNK